MSEQHGTIFWNELMTRDVDAAKTYYTNTCGWTWNTMPMQDGSGDYHVAMLGDQMVGGMMDMTGMPGMDEVPAHWFMYIAVDDVDAAAKATSEGGGMVIREPFDVPEIGRIAIIHDPAGAAVGIMTPSDSQ